MDLDLTLSEVTIGATFLVRRVWGGKYNKELKKLMIAHALASVNTIEFHVGEKNSRSQKALAKIGAKYSYHVEVDSCEGTRQKTFIYTISR